MRFTAQDADQDLKNPTVGSHNPDGGADPEKGTDGHPDDGAAADAHDPGRGLALPPDEQVDHLPDGPDGTLPAWKLGNVWRFKKERIEQWIAATESGRDIEE